MQVVSGGARSAIIVDGGYTSDFLAFKHGLSVKEAAQLIRKVGLSRSALDAEAKIVKEMRSREAPG